MVSDGSALANKIRSELGLLERHVALLKQVEADMPIGIIRLSEKLKLPQHKVRYTLRVLENEGLIQPTPEGAVVTAKMQPFLNTLREALQEMGEVVHSLRESL